MFKAFFACVSALTVSMAALPAALADTAGPPANIAQSHSEDLPILSEKTSDRTPGSFKPNRIPGSNLWGAVGVDAARTPFGTSDRTPENHYHPTTN